MKTLRRHGQRVALSADSLRKARAAMRRIMLIGLAVLLTGCLNPFSSQESDDGIGLSAGHGRVSVQVPLRRPSTMQRWLTSAAQVPIASQTSLSRVSPSSNPMGGTVGGSALSGNASHVTFTVYDAVDNTVVSETIASAPSNFVEFDMILPEGTGYTLHVAFTAETYDGTRVVLEGTSEPFDIVSGGNPWVVIYPLPVDPIHLEAGVVSGPYDYTPATEDYDFFTDGSTWTSGGEVWFAFQPTKPYVDIRVNPEDPDRSGIEAFVYTFQDGVQDDFGVIHDFSESPVEGAYIRRYGPLVTGADGRYPMMYIAVHSQTLAVSGETFVRGGPFSVEVTESDSPVDQVYEPNNDRLSATLLPAGTSIDRAFLETDEEDWYTLTTDAEPGTWHLATMYRLPWEVPMYAWYLNGTEVYTEQTNVGAVLAYQHQADQTAQLRLFPGDRMNDASEYAVRHEVITPNVAELGAVAQPSYTNGGIAAVEVELPEPGIFRITIDEPLRDVATWLQPMVFAADGAMVGDYLTNRILFVDTTTHGTGSYLVILEDMGFLPAGDGPTILVEKTSDQTDIAALQIRADDGTTVLDATWPHQTTTVVHPGSESTVDFYLRNTSPSDVDVFPVQIESWSMANGVQGSWLALSGFRGGVIPAGEDRRVSFFLPPSAPSGVINGETVFYFPGDQRIAFSVEALVPYPADRAEPNESPSSAFLVEADTEYDLTTSLPDDADYFTVSVPAGATYYIDGTWRSDGYPMDISVEPSPNVETGYGDSDAVFITNNGTTTADVVFRPTQTEEFGAYRLTVRTVEDSRSIMYVEHPLGGDWGSDTLVGVPQTGDLPFVVYNDGTKDLKLTSGLVTSPYRLVASFPVTIGAGESATLGIAATNQADEWNSSVVSIRLFSDADVDGTFADTILLRKGYPNPDTYEPNDDKGSAVSLVIGSEVSASVHGDGFPTNPDWYGVDLDADTTYRFLFSAPGSTGTNAEIYRATDDALMQRLNSDGTTTPISWDLTPVDAGSYYIRVSGASVWSYTLVVDVAPQ